MDKLPWVRSLLVATIWVTSIRDVNVRAIAAEPASEHPRPLSPEQEARQFTVADGLAINLVAFEPDVTQPLSISFDDRGRMWVLQYRQYPNPIGLKPVEMDNWLRTKYDQTPEPPPKGPKGADRISICIDTDGDGQADKVKVFVSDLNLASGMALGHGGVFVAQPPYLLFYPDRDQDDVPDGPPEVLLKGFGMEDAHAFANSLTWGPDGWLYGAQGSTATADIRGIGFQQGVWRYHPRTKEFELFAEGGGNTWGVDFDRFGNLFASGNTVEPLVHHVQGAYYVKGFGKHGPLHNPHAYGYFQPVVHHGYLGDSLTGGAILYQGGAFPKQFDGACIAPNTRHSACRWSTLEVRGSTFDTRAAGDFVTCKDIWFRPVDMTVGPDGAVYVADWYDYNISHSSPANRSQWYQPSRLDGRVWRVAPPDVGPIRAGSIDLGKKSTQELVALFSHSNDWYARAARRILAERRDRSVADELTKLALESTDQRLALQGLWALHGAGAMEERAALAALDSPHEYVRAWTVRLLGDVRNVSRTMLPKLVSLARDDRSVVVRGQLACTAKRLPAADAMAIVEPLLHRNEDVADEFVPLLLWWAIEDKAMSDTPLVLRLFESSEAWRSPLAEKFLVGRLARRFLADGSDAGYKACAALVAAAPTEADRDRLVAGMLEALAGRKLARVPNPLEKDLQKLLSEADSKPARMELALRMGLGDPADAAIEFVQNPKNAAADRVALLAALSETGELNAVPAALALIGLNEEESVRFAAVSVLGRFHDDRIADAVLEEYPSLPPSVQARVVELLCSRSSWAARLLERIDAKQIKPDVVSLDQLQRLRGIADDRVAKLVAKHWGRVQPATPLEKQGRITAIEQMLSRGKGEPARGADLFGKHCATCHKLHGKGESIGPDLTVAERKNRSVLVSNVVDPSAMIRQEYLAYTAQTADGRVLTGLLAESTPETITILDAKNVRTTIRRDDVEDLKESATSLMPDNVLDGLSEQQIRDLFAFAQSDGENP